MRKNFAFTLCIKINLFFCRYRLDNPLVRFTRRVRSKEFRLQATATHKFINNNSIILAIFLGMRVSISGGVSIRDANGTGGQAQQPSQIGGVNNLGEQQFRLKGLIHVLCQFNRCSPNLLQKFLIKHPHKNIEYLSTLHIVTSHLKTPLQIAPDMITEKGASRLMAYGKHRSRISVDAYFFCKHKIQLRYPTLPCIGMYGGNNHISFYPLECLSVLTIY